MSSPASSPGGSSGKRGRDPEEDVYVDNLHSHKRYLSEIMASSLNGLSVGDSLADNIMESPARSESPSCASKSPAAGSLLEPASTTPPCASSRQLGCTGARDGHGPAVAPGGSSDTPRDEIISQYSPMSEDSDDYRYFDTQLNPNGSQGDAMVSPSTSPMSSPHRFQKPQAGFVPSTPYPLPSCSLSAVACSHPRRGSENEGRFPSSPNDMCHGADLRRTALLRSVHMRVHGPPAYDLSFSGRQEQEHVHEHEDEHGHEHLEDVGGSERLSHRKSIGDDEAAGYHGAENSYGRQEHDIDYIDRCTSDAVLAGPKFKEEDDTRGGSCTTAYTPMAGLGHVGHRH